MCLSETRKHARPADWRRPWRTAWRFRFFPPSAVVAKVACFPVLVGYQLHACSFARITVHVHQQINGCARDWLVRFSVGYQEHDFHVSCSKCVDRLAAVAQEAEPADAETGYSKRDFLFHGTRQPTITPAIAQRDFSSPP